MGSSRLDRVRVRVWCLLLIAMLGLSVAAAGLVASRRVGWERGYRQVALAVSLASLPFAELPLPDGASGAFDDRPWARLLEGGVRMVVVDAAALEAFSGLYLRPVPALGPSASRSGSGASIPDEAIAHLHALGFGVIPLLPSMRRLDEARLAEALDRLPVEGVILAEAGRPWPFPTLRELIGLLEARGLWAGVLEFDEPEGSDGLYRRGQTRWVRAHLIPAPERQVKSDTEALARWERAVREREVRLVVVSASDGPPSPSPNPNTDSDSDSDSEFVRRHIEALSAQAAALRDRLERAGFSVGEVPLPSPLPLGRGTIFLLLLGPLALALGLGTVTMTVTALDLRWGRSLLRRPALRGGGLLLLLVLVLVLGLGLGVVGLLTLMGDLGRQAGALGTALLAPLGAFMIWVRWGSGSGLIAGLKALGLVSAATVLGGLIQAGLLSDPAYFLKLAEFRGVKLALFGPPLAVFALEVYRRGPGAWSRLLHRPLTWGEALLGAAGAGLLFVLFLRSGNDALIPVPDIERAVRGGLEELLYARPRFKEFLIGHPLLILWAALGPLSPSNSDSNSKEKDPVAYPGLGRPFLGALGWIGQTSILNSFAHLHTPLLLTLGRTANGLLLGALVGLVLWGLWRGGQRWRNRLRL